MTLPQRLLLAVQGNAQLQRLLLVLGIVVVTIVVAALDIQR